MYLYSRLLGYDPADEYMNVLPDPLAGYRQRVKRFGAGKAFYKIGM